MPPLNSGVRWHSDGNAMPMIPAFCDSCGTAFESGIFIEDCLNVTLSGNKAGPCPKCGSMGSVIDGVFNVSRDLIEIISAPAWTIDRLERLAALLAAIRDTRDDPQAALDRAKSQEPELRNVLDALPKTRMELYAFITMLIALIAVWLNQCSDETSTEPPQEHFPEPQFVLNSAIEEILK